MAKIIPRGIQLAGDLVTRGGVALTVWLFDNAGDVLWAKGASVPADTGVGFAVGSIFVQSDGTTNTTLYVNEGTATSCDFNAAVDN